MAPGRRIRDPQAASPLLDRSDPALTPAPQHGPKQRCAVLEAAVEAALGGAEILGEHLDPHALDAGSRELKAGLYPQRHGPS